MSVLWVCILLGMAIFASSLPLALVARKKSDGKARRRLSCMALAAMCLGLIPMLLGHYYTQKHAVYKADSGTITELHQRRVGKTWEWEVAIQTEDGAPESFSAPPIRGLEVGEEVRFGYRQYTHSRYIRDLKVLHGPNADIELHEPDRSSELLISSGVLLLIVLLLMTPPVQALFLLDKEKSEAVRRQRRFAAERVV